MNQFPSSSGSGSSRIDSRCFICSVSGGMSLAGTRNEERLHRSTNTLYLSLKKPNKVFPAIYKLINTTENMEVCLDTDIQNFTNVKFMAIS